MDHRFALLACWTVTAVIFFLIKYRPQHTSQRSNTSADKLWEEFGATKFVNELSNNTSWIFF